MLTRFTDDYVNEIFAAYETVGQIQQTLCVKEPFMGNSQVLDKLYALSIIIAGIAEHLENDDNADPQVNQSLLLCLRKYLDKAGQLCQCRRPVLDLTNYHDKPLGSETVFQLHEKQYTERIRKQ